MQSEIQGVYFEVCGIFGGEMNDRDRVIVLPEELAKASVSKPGNREMQRLNVLFIVDWYPSQENPVKGVFVREHAKAVSLYNNVVVMRCPEPHATVTKLWRIEEEADQSVTKGIPTYRVWHRSPHLPKGTYTVSRLLYFLSAIRAFRFLVAQGFSPDIIHAHVFEAGFLALILGKLFQIPVVITEQSTAFSERTLESPEIRHARIAFRWADMVLPVSKALQHAIEAYGIRARFCIVPNVVDPALFHPDSTSHPTGAVKRLLFVALLDPSDRKGVPHLMRALARLRQERDDWHLDVVGDGPARLDYEQLVGELRLSDKVSFHGIGTKQQVADFMRKADLFVLPSLFETFSVVTAEALASGLPVVVTRCGGPEEFVTSAVGTVVMPGDVSAMFKALLQTLRDLSRYHREPIASFARERFSPEVVGKTLNQVYEEVLKPQIRK